jgi:hypothetical protein
MSSMILLVLFVGRQKLTKDFGMTGLRSFLTQLAGIDNSLNAAAGLTQAIVILSTSPYQNSSQCIIMEEGEMRW